MDEIISSLSQNTISQATSAYPSSSLYKPTIVLSDQVKRRKERLKDQKSKRHEIQDKIRAINEEKITENEETMDWNNDRVKYESPLMLSEWLVEKPDDFHEKWMMVLCPEGRRTLVVASETVTMAYSKRGKVCRKFPSALPGGNKSNRKHQTVLDCIWSETNQTYYILDVLIWSGQSVMNCDTDFRFFWLKSKISEMPELAQRNHLNKFTFKFLSYYECADEIILSIFLSRENIKRLLESNDHSPNLDGVLFYHRDSIYEPGITPLVGWLKPFMLTAVLNIPICSEMVAETPQNFTTIEQYVNDSGREVNYWWKKNCFK